MTISSAQADAGERARQVRLFIQGDDGYGEGGTAGRLHVGDGSALVQRHCAALARVDTEVLVDDPLHNFFQRFTGLGQHKGFGLF